MTDHREFPPSLLAAIEDLEIAQFVAAGDSDAGTGGVFDGDVVAARDALLDEIKQFADERVQAAIDSITHDGR